MDSKQLERLLELMESHLKIGTKTLRQLRELFKILSEGDGKDTKTQNNSAQYAQGLEMVKLVKSYAQQNTPGFDVLNFEDSEGDQSSPELFEIKQSLEDLELYCQQQQNMLESGY